jgi:hypothetical protein
MLRINILLITLQNRIKLKILVLPKGHLTPYTYIRLQEIYYYLALFSHLSASLRNDLRLRVKSNVHKSLLLYKSRN